HPAGGGREAQQDAPRQPGRADRARASHQGGRGRERFDAGGIRQVHRGRARPLGERAREGGAGEALTSITPISRRLCEGAPRYETISADTACIAGIARNDSSEPPSCPFPPLLSFFLQAPRAKLAPQIKHNGREMP